MKLIHCADIHLDSPMQTHMTARQAATRSAEVLRSFVRMTQYARKTACGRLSLQETSLMETVCGSGR